MRIKLIAAGNKMPAWIDQGFDHYNTRLPKEYRLQLREIGLTKGGGMDENKMLSAIPKNATVIALAVDGENWSSETLADHLQHWSNAGRDIALLIGGPDGLTPACEQTARQRWSLSALTLPHPLVRIVVVEQIYRAWSQLQGHPYHRK